jgi:CubicO group peptidase (beta-lactamase class C family)
MRDRNRPERLPAHDPDSCTRPRHAEEQFPLRNSIQHIPGRLLLARFVRLRGLKISCLPMCMSAAMLILGCRQFTSASMWMQSDQSSETLAEQRREFQTQQLTTDRPNSWVVMPGQHPGLIWRNAERVRELGAEGPFRVRWFNAELQEADSPNAPGRWAAWFEGTAPNGTPLRRSRTFFVLSPKPRVFAPEVSVSFPDLPDTDDGRIWNERTQEINRVATEVLGQALLDSEQSAILLAGLAEAEPLGRPARFIESADVMNRDFHLKLRLKQSPSDRHGIPLAAPRHRDSPAPVLRVGTPGEASVSADAAAQLDAVCKAWWDDTQEPFVSLVARRGVIVLHRAYGEDAAGNAIDRDYRCWVASITKTVSALVFAQFVDQKRILLDQQISDVLPDFPESSPSVPTFRQCFNHTSGLDGPSDFGGVLNPQLDNIVLNGIDANRPGERYRYGGLGIELAMKAMELSTGRCAPRLCHEQLFEPLGFGDVVMTNASSAGYFTAKELAVLAQLIVNRGSYGQQKFFTSDTFAKLLPEPLSMSGQHPVSEGVGLHWRLRDQPGFSSNTVGHGSFSGCILTVDLDQQLVIVQVRRQQGERHGDWSHRFFDAVSKSLLNPSEL